MPVWRTQINMKNVREEDQRIVSDESFEALSTRLRQYVHPHMPVRRILGGKTVSMDVNRADVVTMENLEEVA